MEQKSMVEALDSEIARLQKARTLLMGESLPKRSYVRRSTTPRGPSLEGRKRIAEAMRKRWAAKKRAEKVAAR
jgi:uncharacterized protein (DUF2384 family)